MARHRWTPIVAGGAALVMAGCGGEAGDGSATDERTAEIAQRSQCGTTWDAQPVEQYSGTLGVSKKWVERNEGAVGSASMGCTGTLIADDVFLSAGHCRYRPDDTVKFNFQNDPSGNPRPTTSYVVTEILQQENDDDWDYAVVRLSGSPGVTWGYTRISDRVPQMGDHVSIMQHPDGRPKEIHAGLVNKDSSSLGPNRFEHAVDTSGGSSGAGIVADDGYLIGVHTDAGCVADGGPVGGNSAMRMGRLINHVPALQTVLAAQRGGHGFVMANEPTSASYTPSVAYQFNSKGSTNTVARSSTGNYAVTFPNLGSSGLSGRGRGGNAQVTAYGPGAYCKIGSWDSFGIDVILYVRCFGYNGVARDARFTAVFQRNAFEGFADQHGTSAYVWSQSATYASAAEASASYSWNDADEINTISQSGTGQYKVTLPGVDDLDASVHVSAYGSDNARCQVQSWSSGAVNVVCTNPAGAKVNAQFTMSTGGGGMPVRLSTAANAGAYAFANGPTSSSYTPSLGYQGNNMGGDVTISRSGVGDYLVHVPCDMMLVGDTALVTAFGSGGEQCLVDSWNRLSDESRIRVRCYNGAGSPLDATYTISYVTSSSSNL